jgi:hypothetical protein
MKTQAETAARIFLTGTQTLQKGSVIPDFELSFPDGRSQLLSEFRGRSNLVIVFNVEPDTHALLARLSEQKSQIEVNEAKVLAIVASRRSSSAEDFGFAIAAATNLPKMLAGTQLIVTDRFGEMFVVFPNAKTRALPAANQIVNWLEFINQQCEECSPPEWPE